MLIKKAKANVIFATGAILLASVLVPAAPVQAEMLFDILKRQQTPPDSRPKPVYPAPVYQEQQFDTQGYPPSPRPKVQVPVKRAVVAAPKIYDYKPETLVAIDFSKVDFQITGATKQPVSAALILLPIASASLVLNETGDIGARKEAARFLAMVRDLHAEKDIAEVLVAYYSANPKFIWSQDGKVGTRAKSVMAYLARADEDGLHPQEYLVSLPDETLEGDDRKKAYAAFDVALSARALRYVRDAGEGRIIADKLSAYHDLPRQHVKLGEILEQLSQSDNAVKVLAKAEPQSDWYIALKIALAELKTEDDSENHMVAPDTVLRPEQENPELPKVIALIKKRMPKDYQEKFGDVLEKYKDATTYDLALKPAIQAYQKSVGKAADGVVGPATIAALQGETTAVKRQRIILSMERLRWLPRDFTPRYVFINQPAYQAQYFEDSMEKLSMKTVVGSARNQTYFFYDKIRIVTFNPYWGVPRSIVVNEMMPRILADPSYLSRNGFEVYNDAGRLVDPYAVDWERVATTGYGVNVRQKPGQGNALGELKIMFPNKHDIYLHDTPAKGGFQRDMRATSHGCVRLAQPREMAAAVMGKTVEGLKPYFGKNERNVKLDVQVPVYLVYFTAWPNAQTGQIQYFSDIYARDKAMLEADEKTTKNRLAAM